MISTERIPNNVDLAGNKRLQRALEHWQAYVAAAEPANDRWLENARLHALACRRELERKAR